MKKHDATSELIRGLRRAIAAPIAIVEIHGRAWFSATFTGMRHTIAIVTQGSMDVHEDDIQLRGHLLADLVVIGKVGTNQLLIEALTVEDE